MLLLRSKFRSILSLLLATPRIVPNTPQDDTLCCQTQSGRRRAAPRPRRGWRNFTDLSLLAVKNFSVLYRRRNPRPQNFPVFLLERRISRTDFHDKTQALLPICTNLALGRDFSTEILLFTRRNRTLILTHKTSLFDGCD